MRTALTLLVVLSCCAGAAEAQRRRPRPVVASEGTLQLRSMTDGATVQVDSEKVGTVPLAQPIPLSPGKHTLKITKPGYTEYLDVFTITRGRTTELDIDLLPFAGILHVSSPEPGARVFIDGKFEGVTPVEREVLIGKRTVRVSKAGFYDYIVTFKSVAGKTKRINAKLVPLPIGSTPYRPKPPPPPKWYEKWYVWAGAAGALAAVTVAVVVPVTYSRRDRIGGWGPDPGKHYLANQQ